MIGAAAILFSLIAEGAVAYVLTKLFSGAFAEGEREAASIVTFAVISVAAFAVPRLLDILNVRQQFAALIAVALTFLFVYGGLRIEFAGDIAVWDLAWVGRFIEDATSVSETGYC